MALNKVVVNSDLLKSKHINLAEAALEKLATYRIPPDIIQEGSIIPTLEHVISRTARYPSVCKAAYYLFNKLKKDLHFHKLTTSDEQSHAHKEADGASSENEIMELFQTLGENMIVITGDTPATQEQTSPSISKPNHTPDKNDSGRTFHVNGKSLTPYDTCTIKKTVEMNNEHLIPVHSSLSHNYKTGKALPDISRRDKIDKSLSYESSSRHSSQTVPLSNRLVSNSQKNHYHQIPKENHVFAASEDVRVNRSSDLISQNYSANTCSVPNGKNLVLERKESFLAKESSLLHKGQQPNIPKCNVVSFADIFNGPSRPSSGLSTSVFQRDFKEHQMPRKEEFEEDKSPHPSSFLSGGDAFEDKSLLDESNNLLIDNTDGDASPQRQSESRGEFDMKEGMFKCVYIGGPKQTYLKIREHSYLTDRAEEWGWTIEKIYLKSPAKNSKNVTKELKGGKRKVHFDSRSSSPKKLAVSFDKDKHVQLNSRESKCNTRIPTSANEKVKLDPSCSARQHKHSHLPPGKTSNDFGGNMFPSDPLKPSRCLPTDKRSPVDKMGSIEKQPRHVDPLRERKGTLALVPSSDGNYKIPRGDCEASSKCSKAIDDTTMGFISSKKDKRTIYSGKRTVHDIPSLKIMCSDIIKKNILNMKIARNVPFKVFKPFLEMCSASKLRFIEQQNKHVSKYTGYIWENLYKNEFRDQPHVAGQQWKEMYWRARVKRDHKLKSLTASISNGMAKAHPERQAKLMDVEANNPAMRSKKRVEEPPKIILNGRVSSSSSSNGKSSVSNSSPKIILNGRISNSNGKLEVFDSSPNKVSLDERACASSSNGKSSGSDTSSSPISMQKSQKISKPPKKTVAPLMSKTKKMLNLVNRRR